MSWNEAPTITVKQLLDLFFHLGVPHFQRGRVWGKDSIAALLESLFYDTPCGSLVFWDSGDNLAHGVALADTASPSLDYLVIDGQQRIRSLHEAFTDGPLYDDDVQDVDATSSHDPAKRKQWCINLDRAPGFDDVVRPRARSFPLFVYTTNPTHASTRSPLRQNVLPFTEVRAAKTWENLAAYHPLIKFKDHEESTRQAAQRYHTLHQRILAIEDQELFVARKGPTSNLAEMANLYNRINAGGKQVEIEERAFATLVGLQPTNNSISQGLKSAFAGIHSDRRKVNTRDAWLKREEERAFGFKLFVRVFLQVCQYHFGYRQARSSSSFDLIERDDFRRQFSACSADDVTRLWSETTRALMHVRSVLREELCCDDLRSLPDTTGLMPVLHLLIQYPGLVEQQYRPLLAALCLEIALANLDPRTLQRWVAEANNPTLLAFEVLPKLMREAEASASKQLQQGLDRANSIQDRHVLLLYWLQRHLKASDFQYHLVPNQKGGLKPPELPLDRHAEPQKQHLVPFSYASRIFGPEVRRTASHPFNNVGNLTYISAQLNGLGALSDHFADLAGEGDDNLIAHFVGGTDDHDALVKYEWIRKRLEAGAPAARKDVDFSLETKRLSTGFSRLTAARRRLILAAFEHWRRTLQDEALRSLKVESLDFEHPAGTKKLRIEPQAPLFPIEKNVAQTLRELGFDNETLDRLLLVVRESKRIILSDPLLLRMEITKKKRVWLEVQGRVVSLGLRHVTGPLRAGLFNAVGLADADVALHRLAPVPDFHALLEYCATHGREIERAERPEPLPGGQGAREISSLGYAETVSKRLVALGGSSHKPPRQGAALSLRFHAKKGGRGDRQVLRVDLYSGGRKLGLRFGEECGSRFRKSFPTIPVRLSKHRTFCELGAGKEMVEVLDWVARQPPMFVGTGN